MDNILQDILSSLGLTNIPNITLVISLIIAFVQCFFGYKIIRSWISILGFLLGAAGGYGLVFSLTNNSTYGLIGGIVCAVILSVLAYRVYLSLVFVVAGLATYYICISFLPIHATYIQVVAIMLAIIAAVLAMKYMRPAIICTTAFQGALAAAEILPVFIAFDSSYVKIAGIILGIAGVIVQFLTTKK